MKKFMLMPVLLAATVIASGCGGGDKAEKKVEDPTKETTTNDETTKETPTPETSTSEVKPEETASKSPAKAPAQTATKTPAVIGVDASYVLEEAVAALVIHPQQLLASKLATDNPNVGMVLGMVQGKLGLDLTSIKQVVVSGGPPAQPEDKPGSIVVRFSKPHSGKETVEMLMRADDPTVEVEEITHEGLTYFRAKKPATEEPATEEAATEEKKAEAEEGTTAAEAEEKEEEANPFEDEGFGPPAEPKVLPSVFLPDDKTIVLAEEEPLKRIIAAKDAVKTPLTAALAEVDASSDVVVVLAMTEQLRGMAAMATAGAPPDTLGEFNNLPNELQKLVINASLSPDILFRVNMTLVDDQTAGKITAAINQALKGGLVKTDIQIADLKKAGDDEFTRMGLAAAEEGKKLLAGISPSQSGANVIIDVNGLGEIDYKALIGPAMPFIQMMMMGGMGGPPGGPGPNFGPVPENFGPVPEFEDAPAEEAPAEEKKEEPSSEPEEAEAADEKK